MEGTNDASSVRHPACVSGGVCVSACVAPCHVLVDLIQVVFSVCTEAMATLLGLPLSFTVNPRTEHITTAEYLGRIQCASTRRIH